MPQVMRVKSGVTTLFREALLKVRRCQQTRQSIIFASKLTASP